MVAFLPAFLGLADGLAGIGTVGSFPPPCIVLTTHNHKLSTTEEHPTPLTDICRIHEKQPGSLFLVVCFVRLWDLFKGTVFWNWPRALNPPNHMESTGKKAKGCRHLACPDS